jgi:hypothetical protein
MLQNALGRPKDAMKTGREGLALGRELLLALPPGSPDTDALVGEVATAMNDLRQAAIAGGFTKVSCVLGVRLPAGMEDLVSAWKIAKDLGGPSGERLRADVDQAMRVAEQAYPTVVASVRWPSRFRGPQP